MTLPTAGLEGCVCICVEFGACVFLSGEGTGGVIKSILEAHCRHQYVGPVHPQKLPWQLSNLSKSSVANQLTRQVTLEYLFLTRTWVQDAPAPPHPQPGPVFAPVSHTEADGPPSLSVLRRDDGGSNP